MNTLGDIKSDLHANLFDTEYGTGQKVLYRFVDGTEKEIVAVVRTANARMPDAERKDRSYLDALFTVKDEDIPFPQSGDTIIYNDEEYPFYSVHARTLGMTVIRCVQGRTGVYFP